MPIKFQPNFQMILESILRRILKESQLFRLPSQPILEPILEPILNEFIAFSCCLQPSVPKLRKDQRFFSMWELPPLLEVDTDSINEGSQGSLSPANTSSGVTSCSESWNEVSALLLLLLLLLLFFFPN